MLRYKSNLYPTQALISLNKAKTSDPAPDTRMPLIFIAYKILKASQRKWLHYFFIFHLFFFFFTPLLKISSIIALCQRGKERGHF